MLNLKSAYFYFLAVKINFSKFFKKIYFTTKYYNKSLKSKIPKQFYFFPNALLLSSFVHYKNFTFKISDINPDQFWLKNNSTNETRKLHNFLWLNLIDRKNDASVIKKIISVWIDRNKKYKPIVWESSVLSKRIISWILNANIILTGPNIIFKNDFLESIVVQSNHLKKNFKYETNPSKRIESLTAILLTGLVFQEYLENFEYSINELRKLTEEFFDEDGFPLSRNPNDVLKFLKYFILIKECTKDAHQYIPDFLEEIIIKNLSCLKKITTPDNKIPLFNGGTEIDLSHFYKYLLNLNFKIKAIKGSVGGLEIIKNKKNTVYLDIGDPPSKNYSASYQSGPLSFEYYVDNKKIITNCGYGYNISKKATLLSRLTSAQSTLCVNDVSVVRFERNKLLNSVFGNSLKDTFEVTQKDTMSNELEAKASGCHDAYINNYGYIHKREIKINKKCGDLFGFDELIRKRENTIIKYNIFFHLYPGVSAFKTIGGNNILIQINKNKSLIFSSREHKLSIEKSIFLGGNKILNNLCIIISGKLNNESRIINWEIKKNI